MNMVKEYQYVKIVVDHRYVNIKNNSVKIVMVLEYVNMILTNISVLNVNLKITTQDKS